MILLLTLLHGNAAFVEVLTHLSAAFFAEKPATSEEVASGRLESRALVCVRSRIVEAADASGKSEERVDDGERWDLAATFLEMCSYLLSDKIGDLDHPARQTQNTLAELALTALLVMAQDAQVRSVRECVRNLIFQVQIMGLFCDAAMLVSLDVRKRVQTIACSVLVRHDLLMLVPQDTSLLNRRRKYQPICAMLDVLLSFMGENLDESVSGSCFW